jgi:hypothetical protein
MLTHCINIEVYLAITWEEVEAVLRKSSIGIYFIPKPANSDVITSDAIGIEKAADEDPVTAISPFILAGRIVDGLRK